MLVLESLRNNEPRIGRDLAVRFQAQYDPFQSLEEFTSAVKRYAGQLSDNDQLVVVHIVAHGNHAGIAAHSNGKDSLISWEELRAVLLMLHKSCNKRLFVGMSTCEGANVIKLLGRNQPCPYAYFAGPMKKIFFTDAFDSFVRVYDNLLSLDREAQWRLVTDHYEACGFVVLSAEVMFERAMQKYLEDECTPERLHERRRDMERELIDQYGMVPAVSASLLDREMTLEGQKDFIIHVWKPIFYS